MVRKATEGSPAGAKILIVEDDVDMAEATRLILESKKYEVDVAVDYEEGMNKIKSGKPDLIILDVMLPGKTGFDLAYKLKEDKTTCHIPLLMLTAINVEQPGFDASLKIDGKYLPVDEFIDKPAKPDDLLKKVEKLLKRQGIVGRV